jgi:hexosaminidase
MNKINLLILMAFATGFFFSCLAQQTSKQANYEVIPLPSEITVTTEKPFVLSSSTKIVFPNGNDKMKKNAEFLSEYLQTSVGINPKLRATLQKVLSFVSWLENKNPEAYQISVNDKAITIKGASEAGVFYGIQTLRKALQSAKILPFCTLQ